MPNQNKYSLNAGYPQENINMKGISLKNKTRLADMIQDELREGL